MERREDLEVLQQGPQGVALYHRQDWAEIGPKMDADFLDDRGQLKVVPLSRYGRWTQAQLGLWAQQRAFYFLPTVEAVELLQRLLPEKLERAMEIGAGNGALGRALGIRATDSLQQLRPDVAESYRLMQQPTVRYGDDVEGLSALEAIERYRPEVVVAAWVSHRMDESNIAGGGNPDGVDEWALLSAPSVRRYVFVGHETVHRNKPILKVRHETIAAGCLLSRSVQPGRNVVWVWDKT